jgi:hypothetical protein
MARVRIGSGTGFQATRQVRHIRIKPVVVLLGRFAWIEV